MHTIEMLEQAVDLAKQVGYAVRQEWLAGSGGGGCEFRGRKLLFLDLDLGPTEQLEQVLATLRREPQVAMLAMPGELREVLGVRKSA